MSVFNMKKGITGGGFFEEMAPDGPDESQQATAGMRVSFEVWENVNQDETTGDEVVNPITVLFAGTPVVKDTSGNPVGVRLRLGRQCRKIHVVGGDPVVIPAPTLSTNQLERTTTLTLKYEVVVTETRGDTTEGFDISAVSIVTPGQDPDGT